MQSTRSKEKLRYHKKLRAAERHKWDLEKECRESKEFVEIPKTLAGYMVKLVPIESLNNCDDGLAEAVEAATSWFRFSEKPFRFCNLKSYECEFKGHIFRWDFSAEEKMKDVYFKNKLYKKGQLKLLDIPEDRFQNLAKAQRSILFRALKNTTAGETLFIFIIRTFRGLMCVSMWKRFFGTGFTFLIRRLNLRQRGFPIGLTIKRNVSCGIMKVAIRAVTCTGRKSIF